MGVGDTAPCAQVALKESCLSVCPGHRLTDLTMGCRTCSAREPARTPLVVMLSVVVVVMVMVVAGTQRY